MDHYYFEIGKKRIGLVIALSLLLLCVILFAIDQPASAFDQTIPGGRNMGDLYSWTIENVSGQKNVTHHFTVYTWKMMEPDEPYQWWSDNWAQWFNQTPDPGKKWLFIWLEGYTTGTTTWSYYDHSDRFALWTTNTSISPEPVQLVDVVKIKRGTGWSTELPPVIIAQTINHTTPRGLVYSDDIYGWKEGIEQGRIEPGESNAYNGYLKFQIDNSLKPEDLRLSGWFGYWGTAWWNLVPKEFIQDETWTRRPAAMVTPSDERLSDRPSDTGRGRS